MMKHLASLLLFIVAVESRASDADTGRALLSEMNCTACHAASKTQSIWLLPKAAPRLADIGNRANPEWVRKHILAPQNTMPDVLHGLAVAEREKAADALTHYLYSISAPKWKHVAPDKGAVARGESVFHRVGCVVCHAPQNGAASGENPVPLPGMSEKWNLKGLQSFLFNPLSSHPSGRMPSMGLTDGEAFDVAHYLLRETKIFSPLEVAVYRTRISSLDEIDTSEVSSTTPMDSLSMNVPGATGRLMLRFGGWLLVDQAGDYTFYLTADGSARISLDGKWVEDENSWENERTKAMGVTHLDAGWHLLKLDFAQRGQLLPKLLAEWEGPSVAREPLPMKRMRADRNVEPSPEPAPFVVNAAKSERGKSLYAEMNCASCHEGKSPLKPLTALAALKVDQGCLAEKLAATVPDYHFSNEQRHAVKSALAELNRSELAVPTPQQRVAQTMETYRCTSCHVRDGKGGVSKQLDAFFTANVDDLGDEGRLPPSLDGAGDRLRPEWLAKVFAQGSAVRPYMNTRMPQFGAANVGHLSELFIALDRHAQPLAKVSDSADVLRDAGRKLVGTDGISCIACHRFARQPAHMMQVIDLTTVTERLNEDWFRAFLRDPNHYHPATRMPPFWPGGHSVIPSVLAGDTDRQHAALWTYLSDGARAKFPEGLSRKNMEIVVGGEPVVFRGKLWEAGYRAISVGFSGHVNLAFDAEEMRLSLLWRGRFLDASPNWSVQGAGVIHPLGTDTVVFPHGAAFAVLKDAHAPWPITTSREAGMKFRGYQIDHLKRPTMLYEFRDIAIGDFFANAGSNGKTVLHRTLKFSGPPLEGLFFRAAVGKLVPDGENAWRLDKALTIRLDGRDKAFTRGEGARQELLVPIRLENQKAQLEVEYEW